MSGLASFLVGMGGGYIKSKDKQFERDRQAKEDAWMEEQRGRQRASWSKEDKLSTDLADAAAPRTTMQGTVTESGGQKLFSADPAQAAQLKGMAEGIADLEGTGPVTQQPGAAITGNMSKGHQITTAPVDAAKLNDPNARNQRVTDALMQNGQVERALTMETNVLDQKAKRLGLDVAELKFADEQFNRTLGEKFANTPDWTQAAAQVLSDTQVGGLAGIGVKPVPSKDGKKVDFVGQGPDGNARVLATFDNSDAGKAQFMQRVMRAPVETKIGWIVEEAKARQVQANSDRDFDLRKQESENAQQYRTRMLGIQQAQEARAQAVHRTTMDDAKIPSGVKMQAASLAKQIENIGTALNKAMAEGQFDPNNPGTARLLAQQADLGISYQKLLQPYTPGAAAGPSAATGLPDASVFAAKPEQKTAQSAARPPAPPAGPMSAFEARRQAAIEEEAARKTAAEQAERVRREQERQKALQSRPDLQQMGGMRYFN